jgi:hypothetical protein
VRDWLRLFAALSSISVAFSAAAEPRIALIIGNANYANPSLKLENPTNDAAAMNVALKAAGFETIVKVNANRREFYNAVDEFGAKIAHDPHAVGLFYYAGHGIQVNGKNYLVPVDAVIESESDLKSSAYDADMVLDAMKSAHNEMNIVILDACRDNPLPTTRSLERGLARMDAPNGTFIAYATGPGKTAHDGAKGTNGVFTGEFVKAMALPGVPLEQMYKTVINGVTADTRGAQQPWSEASIRGDFYFHDGPARTPTPAAPIHVPTPEELDESYWLQIKGSTNASDFKDYIKAFPKGLHVPDAELATNRLARSAAVAPAARPASAAVLTPGGPYPSWFNSNLIPQGGTETITVNKDGSLEIIGPNPTFHGHAVFNLSDPNNVTGIKTTYLGVLNGVQARFPDGTTKGQETLTGKLVNGVITGTWFDQFQHGQFQWTVGPVK